MAKREDLSIPRLRETLPLPGDEHPGTKFVTPAEPCRNSLLCPKVATSCIGHALNGQPHSIHPNAASRMPSSN